MQAQKAHYPVRMMARVLKVSPSGYYAWCTRPVARRHLENRRLLMKIRELYRISKGRYGAPRIHRDLVDLGYECSRSRVARLMRAHGIKAKQKRRFKATTNSRHRYPVAENLLLRIPAPDAIDQVWVSDITYIPTDEGWLYLAAVMDLYSRKLIGWAMDKRMTRHLAIEALTMALWQRKPARGLIHHSDRGSQYASYDYQDVLKDHGVVPSMSRKGNCYDNASMESFFGSLKTELVFHEIYETRKEAKQSIFNYIETFYNRIRRHSSLGYLSPVHFERSVA